MKRDHSNPAARTSRMLKTLMRPKPRPKAPEPLPVRMNACPKCSNDNVAIERVERCRVCGTKIPPPWQWFQDSVYQQRRKAYYE